ncbi:permease-like cell division protein FtsX [Alicyclobacillus dauci]|uniref:Cell division protein FtsX n=1 Tax=Alicyclobacillus dauci TaxID=1475485 RepID=A0ABY6Z3P1_9BACL|nr:permease-like cell division protein FtsX [Alicyclobacillus dauci]WAH36605.1 permease-like cell division protein FtsX [Alicyclobacillus dauci]
MMTRIARHLREGLRNLLRNGWMTFASVSAVMVTLAVLGLSLILAMNAQQVSTYVANQVEFSAFLSPSASQQTGDQVATEIRDMPGVKSVQVVSKDQGLNQMKQELGSQYNDVLNGFKSNPIPIKLTVQANNPRDIMQIADQVKKMPEVKTVRDPHDIVGPLFHTLDVVRDVGILFVVALLVTSMFLISNTIRITIFSRRREIEIMKLVGATNWFIRWPFIVEGMFIGLLGAVIPFAILGYGYNALYSYVHGTFVGLAFPLVQSGDLSMKLAIVLIGIGVVIGVWGGVMSVRKFLRV